MGKGRRGRKQRREWERRGGMKRGGEEKGEEGKGEGNIIFATRNVLIKIYSIISSTVTVCGDKLNVFNVSMQ